VANSPAERLVLFFHDALFMIVMIVFFNFADVFDVTQ
jgi:hypothetical protein